MRTESPPRNPFLLMLNPELVLAAIQRSEKLEQLVRRTCHPLDRPAPNGAADAAMTHRGVVSRPPRVA